MFSAGIMQIKACFELFQSRLVFLKQLNPTAFPPRALQSGRILLVVRNISCSGIKSLNQHIGRKTYGKTALSAAYQHFLKSKRPV